jgi:hypothetical protein
MTERPGKSMPAADLEALRAEVSGVFEGKQGR